MHIAITGGIGSIGRGAVAHFLARGYRVRILDRQPASEIAPDVLARIRGAEYRQVDITDFDALRGIFDGLDAVVHLAALPTPALGPEHVVYDINVRGTFNIYRTAADAGIQRVVSASSINALGHNYGIKAFPIRYFPIDEQHPDYTTDVYSFSKRSLEETAAYFWRREGISGVCLRFPHVYHLDAQQEDRRKEFMQHRAQALREFEALPEEARITRAKAAVARGEEFRALRLKEKPFEEQRRYWEARRAEGPPPPEAILCWGRTDFWATLSIFDACQAIEKGLTADYIGSHPIFVNDSHNSAGYPSRQLVRYCFPGVTEWKQDVTGTETLVSIDKARALIGFEPQHSISRWFDGGE